ncbi:MBL fold metallo-hydrolase [Pseudomonas sp. TH03]|uniref:ComEC/Rec2 family competence protein n=1 Tax=Pseudomonas sp. TH03 TaxID=2796369 RepID=UPI0019138BDF|nr:MBL fold metallo-hydrolase [Pseudomonas sp. TH03]MBK5552143.1 MBL fold metallo-hydrolase [Pseudomonas sp. TH03]
MTISVRVLHAGHGDCIFISHQSDGNTFNLLIDGGPAATFGSLYGYPSPLRLLLEELKETGQIIDLAVLTHVDDDHIGGFLEAFSHDDYLPSMVREVWFNSYKLISKESGAADDDKNHVEGISSSDTKTSITQGITLEEKLVGINWWQKVIRNDLPVIVRGGLEFTILSPSVECLGKLQKKWVREAGSDVKKTAKEQTDYHLSVADLIRNDKFVKDASVPNGSSIAFILRADDKNIVLLGDAFANIVTAKLLDLGYSEECPLVAEVVKVSHHGSKKNTSSELLNLIRSERFVISTDGAIFGHPDKRAVARILKNNEANNIFFNYESVIRGMLLSGEEEYMSRLHVFPSEMVL